MQFAIHTCNATAMEPQPRSALAKPARARIVEKEARAWVSAQLQTPQGSTGSVCLEASRASPPITSDNATDLPRAMLFARRTGDSWKHPKY